MSRLILHIGFPKAGSTAIQTSLLEGRHQLRREGGLLVLPPNPYGTPLPSGFLAANYLPSDQLPRFLALRFRRNPDGFNRDLKLYLALLDDLLRIGRPADGQRAWRARLQRLKARVLPVRSLNAILSSEYLWRLERDHIQRLRRDFEALGVERFLVIAYVRDPVSAYASLLQQWLRYSLDLERYNPYAGSHYPVREYLQNWRDVFRADELIVRPFHASPRGGWSVVADFYQQCSAWLGKQVAGPDSCVVNQSLTVEELVLIQRLLQAVPDARRSDARWPMTMSKFLKLLRSEASRLECLPVQLQPWVRRVVWERATDDQDWLRNAYGIQFQPPASSDLACTLPAKCDSFQLHDLILPPRDGALVDQLQQRQLEAVVREGLG